MKRSSYARGFRCANARNAAAIRTRARAGIRIAGQGLELASEVLERRASDRSDERPPIGEPLVQGRGSNADALGDGEHRDRVEAAGLEELSTGGHDVVVATCEPGLDSRPRPPHPAEMRVMERGRQLETVADRSVHPDVGDENGSRQHDRR